MRHHVHATIHRYEGVNASGASEVIRRFNETLLPQLRELHGSVGHYLIEGGGVLSLLGFFDSSDQADQSTEVISQWIIDERVSALLPDAPRITNGYVVAQSNTAVVGVT